MAKKRSLIMVLSEKCRVVDNREAGVGTSVGDNRRADQLPWRHYKAETVHAGVQANKGVQGDGGLLQEGAAERRSEGSVEGSLLQHSARNRLFSVLDFL